MCICAYMCMCVQVYMRVDEWTCMQYIDVYVLTCVCVGLCVCVWWICVGLSGFFRELNLGKRSLSWGVGNGLYIVYQFLGVWNMNLGLARATYWVTDQPKLKSETQFYSLKKFRVALGSFLLISWEAARPRSHWSLRWFRVQATDHMFPATVHHNNGR